MRRSILRLPLPLALLLAPPRPALRRGCEAVWAVVLLSAIGCVTPTDSIDGAAIRSRIEELSVESPDSRDKFIAEERRARRSGELGERIAAVIVLSRSPNHGQVRVLCALAHDADDAVRSEALYGLGILNDMAAVPFLVERLRRKEDFYGALAGLGLLRYGLSGHEPLSAGCYVAEHPVRELGLPDVPECSREQIAEDYEKWWLQNGERLTRGRHVGEDFWPE